jgi:hypothetical protein
MSVSLLISANDHRGLLRVIESSSRALAKRSDFLPEAAGYSAHAAADDPSLGEAERAALIAQYERACVEHLRNMLAAKLDVLWYVEDPIYDALRERERFRQLVADAQSRR